MSRASQTDALKAAQALAALPGQGTPEDYLATLGKEIVKCLRDAGDQLDEVQSRLIRSCRYRPAPAEVQEVIEAVRRETAGKARTSLKGCLDCGGSGWVRVYGLRRRRRGEEPGLRTISAACGCERGGLILSGTLEHGPHPREVVSLRDVVEAARRDLVPRGQVGLLAFHVDSAGSGEVLPAWARPKEGMVPRKAGDRFRRQRGDQWRPAAEARPQDPTIDRDDLDDAWSSR